MGRPMGPAGPIIVNQTAMLGAINVAGPQARTLLERLCDDDLSRPRSGSHATGRSPSPAWAVARSASGSWARSPSSCTTPVRGAWSCGTRCGGGRRPRHRAARAGRARRAAAGEGPRLPRTGHLARRPSRQARARMERGDGQARVRREDGAGADGGDPARAEVGGAAVRRRSPAGRARLRRRAHRRARDVVRALGVAPAWIGLGWIRSVEGVFPSNLRAGDVTARVVPTPFYDPEGARQRA